MAGVGCTTSSTNSTSHDEDPAVALAEADTSRLHAKPDGFTPGGGQVGAPGSPHSEAASVVEAVSPVEDPLLGSSRNRPFSLEISPFRRR